MGYHSASNPKVAASSVVSEMTGDPANRIVLFAAICLLVTRGGAQRQPPTAAALESEAVDGSGLWYATDGTSSTGSHAKPFSPRLLAIGLAVCIGLNTAAEHLRVTRGSVHAHFHWLDFLLPVGVVTAIACAFIGRRLPRLSVALLALPCAAVGAKDF
jgi:hypothetical protein